MIIIRLESSSIIIHVWDLAYEVIKDSPRAHYGRSDNMGCLVGLAEKRFPGKL